MEKNHINIRAQFESIFKKSDYLFLSALKREEFFDLMKNNDKLINGLIRLIHKGLPISSDSLNILKIKDKYLDESSIDKESPRDALIHMKDYRLQDKVTKKLKHGLFVDEVVFYDKAAST